jgi:hypothetical protein
MNLPHLSPQERLRVAEQALDALSEEDESIFRERPAGQDLVPGTAVPLDDLLAQQRALHPVNWRVVVRPEFLELPASSL